MAMADVRSFFALDWPLGVDFSISVSIQSAGNMASPASPARTCPARMCPAKRSERDGASKVKYVRFQSEKQLQLQLQDQDQRQLKDLHGLSSITNPRSVIRSP